MIKLGLLIRLIKKKSIWSNKLIKKTWIRKNKIKFSVKLIIEF